MGCLNGGREALTLSHRVPDYFDGILAVGPTLGGSPLNSDLTAFNRRGGKMIVVHGLRASIASNDDTIDWWSRVDAGEASIGDTASSFVRLFALNGPDDRFDAFAALVDWVEKSLIPDRIIATARDATPLPGQTRPLCAYPQRARYIGIGSFEDANNFACRDAAP